jgi:small subunit ribosomal protein S15
MMARIYSGRRGKAGSKKPLAPAQWVEYKKEEVERVVVKLAKDGYQSASVGKILRDQYGIPSVKSVTGKTVTQIMKENNVLLEIPEDLLNLLKSAVKLYEHMKKHKKDNASKYGLELLNSRIRRMAKYYVRTGRLPAGWVYEPERAKLIIQTAK